MHTARIRPFTKPPLPAWRPVQKAVGRGPRAIAWPCVHEVFAIATHALISNPLTPGARAIDQIDASLECPSLVLLAETEGHWPTLRPLLQKSRIAGPAVQSAHRSALPSAR